MSEVFDVVVVGSGPAGYTAGIYAGRAGLKTIIVAGSIEAGGALVNTSVVDNYPGFSEGVMGPELMRQMEAQARRFVEKVVMKNVIKIDDIEKDLKKVIDEDGNSYYARSVILATGSAHRHLNVPGEEEFSGEGVSYCATCDAAFFKGMTVIVAGGGDTALEDASTLAKFAKEVVIVHRRDQFRASKAMVDRISNIPNIKVSFSSVIKEIYGDSEGVSSVLLEDTLTGQSSVMDAEGVFVAIGSDPRTDLFKDIVEFTETGHVKVAEPSTRTNLSGVFACGDVVDDHYQQAITAAGSGCRAGLDAAAFIDNLKAV